MSGSQSPGGNYKAGPADQLKGQLPVWFLVLKAGVERPHEVIVAEVVKMVRARIGAVAAFKTATVVDRLPKTGSGKILRATMRKIADGEQYTREEAHDWCCDQFGGSDRDRLVWT